MSTNSPPMITHPGRRRSDSSASNAQAPLRRQAARPTNALRPVLSLAVRATCLLVHSLFVVAMSVSLVLALALWLLVQVRKGVA